MHPTANVVVGEIFQRSNYQIGSEPQDTSPVSFNHRRQLRSCGAMVD